MLVKRALIRVSIIITSTVLLAACVPPAAPPDLHGHPFLVCTRKWESDRSDVNGNGLHDGGYQAIDPSGQHFGAYQFKRSTWDSWARSMGWDLLVGMDPRDASVNDQDQMAFSLYESAGNGPWGGRC